MSKFKYGLAALAIAFSTAGAIQDAEAQAPANVNKTEVSNKASEEKYIGYQAGEWSAAHKGIGIAVHRGTGDVETVDQLIEMMQKVLEKNGIESEVFIGKSAGATTVYSFFMDNQNYMTQNKATDVAALFPQMIKDFKLKQEQAVAKDGPKAEQ